MTPSFNDLRYFYEVATTLNFTHAAKRIGVSQPSLSMAMSRLEKILNAQLFVRNSQGVTLTQSGERLFSHVGDLLDKWHRTTSSISSLNEEISGKVVIGCHSSHLNHMNQLISHLLVLYPLLDIQILNDVSLKTTQGVVDGVIDIGIVYEPVKHPALIMHKISNIEITCWIKLQGNYDASVIICDSHIAQIQFLLSEFKKRNPAPRVCSINNLHMVAELTATGAGIGVLPTCMVNLEHYDKLKKLSGAPVLYGELYLISRGENRNILGKETVLSAIKKMFL